MTVQQQAVVRRRSAIAPAWWELEVELTSPGPNFAPGQFFLVRCEGCYLRRAIFPQPFNKNEQGDEAHFSLLLSPSSDAGLAWLAARQPGDALDLLGPLGHGLPQPLPSQNLLLVSDSRRLSPLLAIMAQAVAEQRGVTLALGGSRAAAIYSARRLPPAVELQSATRDGSLGHRGEITEQLAGALRWADGVYAVGSLSLYHRLKQLAQQVRFHLPPDFLFGLMHHRPLPCGVGACCGCLLPTTHGLTPICRRGPFLDLSTLSLSEIADD